MALAPGSHLGPFEILGPLDAGGMGEVYRARDTRLGREVAIKILPEQYAADADRLRRFEQEARAASALNHPNIVTVHEVGRAGATPYIAMERVEGRSLRDLIAGPLPLRKLLGYPGPGERTRISSNGGFAPAWSRDGKELFFLGSGQMLAVGVETRPTFRAGPPRPLFEATRLMSTSYDVGADQVGFVMTRLVRGGPLGPDALSRPLSLVLGWSEDVAQRVQAAGK